MRDGQGAALGEIQTLFQLGTLGALSDRQLLERYTQRAGEAAELAFGALVARHGPMVLRVCRSLLRDEHAAHDAFQATFLVLVRRSRGLWVQDLLGPWLHQVACRVAACARSSAARRRRIERQAAALKLNESREAAGGDLASVIHEEIDRLPERYRAALVLCCVEELTQQQAAQQLGWRLGTLQSRLARGRQQLRGRLARRGLAPLAGTVASALGGRSEAAPVPARLIHETTRAARIIAGWKGDAAGTVSAAVVALMEGGLHAMYLGKLKSIAMMTVVLGVAVAGAVVLARQPTETNATPARENMMRVMPDYVVEPPDLLVVEVPDALPNLPITGERLVRPDGRISLGYYGEVYVAGLTPGEIKEKVVLHLRRFLSDKQLGLVAQDARRPGQAERVEPADTVKAYVDVKAYNSKSYYVLGEVAAPGRMCVTGNETVLDAINYAGGLLATAAQDKLRLVRPPGRGASNPQVLPVNYTAIIYEGDPTTNYQLQPGDRLIVPRDTRAQDEPAQEAAASPAPVPEQAEAAPADLQTLNRRLDGVERKLDRLIELLGGASTPPRGSGTESRPGAR